ncbi:52 kDa repressor of the inhibitor of the protein kinase-like isoform X2 [Odontomachus brunneus]|uniref:52 kDa repressor of the inhibitor of the protein kinase-like isoform X2 n=1 Tax=Odontomachus brunneus TaxID=486640 RepID=UPI0013F27DA5|nr:52 kDa repressor of the inhibitor of the protein kinase-like isoform X2 [Odontomachus brunneus]XP_032675742.1 52 kDa repressor of the inhibitor of the protein kinase-like isoform X2 [Odontomachus brunneus]
MSARESNAWCIVRECNKNIGKKRHFFSFPKEHDRWLQWIHACERSDLKVMGAEYAYRTYRLCHLHFEEKWYRINKSRSYLHPDAIPTIFFGKKRDNMSAVTTVMEENGKEIYETKVPNKRRKDNFNILERDCEQQESNTHMCSSTNFTEDLESARNRKLQQQYVKWKKIMKSLKNDQRNRRPQKKIENLVNTESHRKVPENELQTLHQLKEYMVSNGESFE